MNEWINDLFSTIDAKDADAFAGFLADDAVFRFGNALEVHGRGAIRDVVAGFFAAIAGPRHEISDTWDTADAVITLGSVTYTRLDGSTLTVPFANVFRMRAGGIGEYLIYDDTSALFVAMSALSRHGDVSPR